MNPEGAAGTVYAVEAGGLVKIGFTSGPIERRIGELQRMNGNLLELVRSWEGTLGTERALHKTFAQYRQQGEWFALPVGWEEDADRAVEIDNASEIDVMADELAEQLECAGHVGISGLEILDALACAGLTLARGGGRASGAYFGTLMEEETP